MNKSILYKDTLHICGQICPSSNISLVWFKHIHLSSIAKQVLATYTYNFPSPLPGTNQYWWWHIKKNGHDPGRAQIHDLERQTA
jgi:hypothetical protein